MIRQPLYDTVLFDKYSRIRIVLPFLAKYTKNEEGEWTSEVTLTHTNNRERVSSVPCIPPEWEFTFYYNYTL